MSHNWLPGLPRDMGTRGHPRRKTSGSVNVSDEILKMKTPRYRRTFTADPRYHPIVVLKSNSEKNLPDAFLRRYVFYHIPFPDQQHLRRIIECRLPRTSLFTPSMIESAIKEFLRIRRTLDLKKQPATAELLGWVRILADLQIDLDNLKPGQIESVIERFGA
jgi:MoxR-like ATPase